MSLHAPNQKLREQLVPSARVYPIDALLRDTSMYFRRTSRRVSIEYTLLDNVNDTTQQVRDAWRLRGSVAFCHSSSSVTGTR